MDGGLGDQFHFMQGLVDRSVHKIIDLLTVGEMDLHLGGMDVYVRQLRGHGQMQDREGEAVLHQIGPVALFQGFGQDIASEHASVDKEGLEPPAGAADLRPSDKALQLQISFLHGQWQDPLCYVSSVDPVDQFL